MRKEFEDKLRETAPQFLAEMDLDAMESCMAWGIECGDGWYMPLKRFCEAVEAMNNTSPDKVIVAKQIKAKFGEMTVYWALEEKGKPLLEREATQNVLMEYLMKEAVVELENECRMTCELCGSTDEVTEERWLYSCKDCKEKRKKGGNMVRLECHKCKRLAFTGELKLKNDEQVFICWRCREKAELEREKKLKTEYEEEQIPNMPPPKTEEEVWWKNQSEEEEKRKQFLEDCERLQRLHRGMDYMFGPYPPNYSGPWIVPAENDLVNRQPTKQTAK